MQRYVGSGFRIRSSRWDAFWKHSVPPDYQRIYFKRWKEDEAFPTHEIFPTTLFICMIRIPYFWLNSTVRRSYNIRFMTGQTFSERLRSEVRMKGKSYPNIVEFWNHYYRSVIEHIEPYADVRFFQLEKLVDQPHETLKSLSEIVPMRPRVSLEEMIDKLFNTPMKKRNAFGEKARQMYQIQNVTEMIDHDDLVFINSMLDPQIMRRFDLPLVWTRPEVS